MSTAEDAVYVLQGEVTSLKDLAGRIFTSVKRLGDEEICFYFSDTKYVRMYHDQDCCESVWIDDVCGDLEDLVDAHVVHFEERTSEGEKSKWGDHQTWTFYDIQTTKGCVNIRWCGESNGYYSETIDVQLVGVEEDPLRINWDD